MARLKLHVLDLGRLRLRSSVLIASGPSPFPDRVEVPVSAYCIDHPGGRVLFDTGCHPDAMGPNGRWSPEFQRDYPHLGGEECTLPHRLEQIGLGPDDFRYVVLSHMHSDHAGCVEFFRKSQLVVHTDEFAAAIAAYRARDERAYAWKDTAAWIDDSLTWRQVSPDEGDLTIHDEVRILNFGRGHSFGMLGLSVQLGGAGTIVLASDAIYCAENFQEPAALPGSLRNAAAYKRTLSRIRRLADDGAQVWFGHDPRQFATLRKSAEGWYE
ncbi:MAG TPA: N-acyl homoserine lactonase family protein [Dongiaceae bacterium]|jgi:glyoxylase-like metal-dependent hydrolase (beta-lactamase superfamily II)|nr:N-acyl homoserine lactonase family protein [Dongiaceae bacterium]